MSLNKFNKMTIKIMDLNLTTLFYIVLQNRTMIVLTNVMQFSVITLKTCNINESK